MRWSIDGLTISIFDKNNNAPLFKNNLSFLCSNFITINEIINRIFKVKSDLALEVWVRIDSNTPDSLDCQNSNYLYPSAGHVIKGNLNVIPDARVRNIISKGPKYRFPSNIDFPKCCREIPASLNDKGEMLNLMP